MRISELSRSTGVPIPTIKFYLREGLLDPGQRSAPNQAQYDETHLRRLRLIRVLQEVGGLSLASVRDVLGALAVRDAPLHETLAAAHTALRHEAPGREPALAATREETDAWLAALGWDLAPEAAGRDALAATLLALRRLGWPVGPDVFERYARHADDMAAAEIAYVADAPDREAAVEATVIGTVVFERALVALRRLAEEHHSRRLLGSKPPEPAKRSPGPGDR